MSGLTGLADAPERAPPHGRGPSGKKRAPRSTGAAAHVHMDSCSVRCWARSTVGSVDGLAPHFTGSTLSFKYAGLHFHGALT